MMSNPFLCDGSAWASPQYLPRPDAHQGLGRCRESSFPAPSASSCAGRCLYLLGLMKRNEHVAGLIEKAGRESSARGIGEQCCLVAHDAALGPPRLREFSYERFRHPSLLSGGHLQPSLHVRMEQTEIVHDPDPVSKSSGPGASREIDGRSSRPWRSPYAGRCPHSPTQRCRSRAAPRARVQTPGCRFRSRKPEARLLARENLTQEQRTPVLLPPGYSVEPS